MKHARLIGLVLLYLSAALVTLHGIRDLTILSVPEFILAHLGAPELEPDERTTSLILALLHALGAALAAVGLVALTLINGPVRRGSTSALVATILMITFVEGVNAWSAWTVSAPWWGAIAFIVLAIAGAVFLVISARTPAPAKALDD